MSVPKILLCRALPTKLLDEQESKGKIQVIRQPKEDGELAPSRDWVLKNIKGATGVVICMTEKIDDELLDAAGPSLKVISTMSVGYDHIDLKAVKQREIRVGNTPGVLDDAVAELCLMLALMVTRRASEATRLVREGEWPNQPWTPTCFCGPSLRGKTIGFLGFGNISQSLASLLVPFQPAEIIYTTSKPRPFDIHDDYFGNLRKRFFPVDRIKTVNEPDTLKLAAKADIVFVLVDLNSSTKHLVSRQFLSAMKQTAYVVNGARGGVVDTEALAEAIRSGSIAGVGLDVIEGEPKIDRTHALLQPDCRDRVVLLPHIGSGTTEARRGMADMTINNLLGALGLRGETGKEHTMDSEL